MYHPFFNTTMAELRIQELQKEAARQSRFNSTNPSSNPSGSKPIAVMAKTFLIIVSTILLSMVIWLSIYV